MDEDRGKNQLIKHAISHGDLQWSERKSEEE